MCRKSIIVLAFVFLLIGGNRFAPPVEAREPSRTAFATSKFENQTRRRRTPSRARSGERLIIHRNSGTVRRAICRDGAISLSRHNRGTCSHHGGVKSWLR